MTMIEKVARAMYRDYDWGMANGMKATMFNTAKAAIEAMKDPTEEMIKAGDQKQIDLGIQEVESKDTWVAMIEAALKQ